MPHVLKQKLAFRFSKAANNTNRYHRIDSTINHCYLVSGVHTFYDEGFVVFDMLERRLVKGKLRERVYMNCCCSIDSFRARFEVGY